MTTTIIFRVEIIQKRCVILVTRFYCITVVKTSQRFSANPCAYTVIVLCSMFLVLFKHYIILPLFTYRQAVTLILYIPLCCVVSTVIIWYRYSARFVQYRYQVVWICFFDAFPCDRRKRNFRVHRLSAATWSIFDQVHHIRLRGHHRSTLVNYFFTKQHLNTVFTNGYRFSYLRCHDYLH
jgi:hypothetical protein